MRDHTGTSPEGARRPPDGIFVYGSPDAPLQSVARVARELVQARPDPRNARATKDLTAVNEGLLHRLGGSVTEPPRVSLSEMMRILQPCADEARQAFYAAHKDAIDACIPWVWADPRNSLLAPFWIDLLNADPLAVLVFNAPDELVPSPMGDAASDVETDITRWDFFNRTALTVTNLVPTIVVSVQQLRDAPVTTYEALAKFMGHFGLSAITLDIATMEPPRSDSVGQSLQPATGSLPNHARVLHELLTRYEGLSAIGLSSTDEANKDIVLGFDTIYDERYYEAYTGGIPYVRDEPHWIAFFGDIAKKIHDRLSPKTVLDVGCAIGMLVEALRSQGIDADGIDVSEWAIAQVPEPLRPYCRVGSITEELADHYDLITCIEVLEHLPRSMAAAAVSNLCRHADQILFSSTPDCFDEPTHLNVESPSYWAQLFAAHGFTRDFDFDASFLAPHATLFSRSETEVDGVISGYERALWNLRTDLLGAHDELMATRSRTTEEIDEPFRP